MDKKATSKPMRAILSRLPEEYFDVTIFGDDTILNKPVEEWPVVECLITFFSGQFPMDKGLSYVELRKPFMINELDMKILGDRRRVYEMLVKNGIAVPRHVFLERDDPVKVETNVVEEFDEYIIVNGVQINKPLVEKPVDAEDHAIYIYYPMSAGGGSKRLFRKVKDRRCHPGSDHPHPFSPPLPSNLMCTPVLVLTPIPASYYCTARSSTRSTMTSARKALTSTRSS
jgi:inositol hexakisphosphate/diphosphoinositol-pentakisphosphate kinase